MSTERTLTCGDAGLEQRVDRRVAQVVAALDDDVALRVDRVGGQRAGVRRGLDVRIADQGAVGLALGQVDDDAALGPAVVLADDDVLATRPPDDGSGNPSRRYEARCPPDPFGRRGC